MSSSAVIINQLPAPLRRASFQGDSSNEHDNGGNKAEAIYNRHMNLLEAALQEMPWLQDPLPSPTQVATTPTPSTVFGKQSKNKSTSNKVASKKIEQPAVVSVSTKNKGGLSSFLSKKSSSSSEKSKSSTTTTTSTSPKQPTCLNEEHASTEFTVHTTESDDDAAWAEVQVVRRESERRVAALQAKIAEQQELAQVYYMTRNQGAALDAMRSSHHQRAALECEEQVVSQLTALQAKIDNHHRHDDYMTSLYKLEEQAAAARASVSLSGKEDDDKALLQEIRNLIMQD